MRVFASSPWTTAWRRAGFAGIGQMSDAGDCLTRTAGAAENCAAKKKTGV